MTSHSTPLRLIRPAPLTEIARDAIAEYRRKRQLIGERDAITEIATTHGHALGAWRVEDTATAAVIQCWACGEGARLDLRSACARLTQGLTARCQGLPANSEVFRER